MLNGCPASVRASLLHVWESRTQAWTAARCGCCHTQCLGQAVLHAEGLPSKACKKQSPAAGASAAVPSARLGRLVGVPGSALAPGAWSGAWTAASLRPLLSRGLSEGLSAAPDRDS